jgi:hypothetical protein
MIDRCTLPTDKCWDRWGGRGIGVCDEWRKFEQFLADMGEAPVGMSIDRIDNEKGYSKDNCRWATWKEQANNRRSNHRLEYAGENLTLSQWAVKTGIGKATLRHRIAVGWSVKDALTTEVKPYRRNNHD